MKHEEREYGWLGAARRIYTDNIKSNFKDIKSESWPAFIWCNEMNRWWHFVDSVTKNFVYIKCCELFE